MRLCLYLFLVEMGYQYFMCQTEVVNILKFVHFGVVVNSYHEL